MARLDKNSDELEITARPKSTPEELGTTPKHEAGLSIDTEELGQNFLIEATEQRNFESERGGDAADLSLNDEPPSDEALTGPNYEADKSVWEKTAGLTLQSGGIEQAKEELAPPLPSDDSGDDDDRLRDGSQALDLTDGDIRELSMLDHEAATLGDTEAPVLRTDDSRTETKRRGGSAPAAAPARRRAGGGRR